MAGIFRRIINVPSMVAIGLIRLYQIMASPWPSPCRYTPTCSAYTLEAIRRFGAIKGSWLGMFRILRCHPFTKGGIDPVPEPKVTTQRLDG